LTCFTYFVSLGSLIAGTTVSSAMRSTPPAGSTAAVRTVE
jgi:hypothetical protein